MKKTLSHLLLTGIGFIIFNYGFAQPTLTATNINPTIGEKFIFRTAAYISPGANGANKTWNFASLVPTGSDSLEYISKASAPMGSNFSSSNMVIKNKTFYQYIEKTASVIRTHGAYSSTQNTIINYSNPTDIFKYPITYNYNYSDTYKATQTTGGTVVYRSGTLQVHADGYGTLVTPTGTYTNVMRIRMLDNVRDSTSFFGNPFINITTIETYDWYQPGNSYPIMRIVETISQAGTNRSVLYQANKIVNVLDPLLSINNINLYPNPASEKATLNYDLKKASQVKITLHNLLGQEIAVLVNEAQVAGSKMQQLELEKYPKGMYLVQVQLENQIITKRLIKQ